MLKSYDLIYIYICRTFGHPMAVLFSKDPRLEVLPALRDGVVLGKQSRRDKLPMEAMVLS